MSSSHCCFSNWSFSCALCHLSFYMELNSNTLSPRTCPSSPWQKNAPSNSYFLFISSPYFCFLHRACQYLALFIGYMCAYLSPLEWKLPENRDFPSDGPLQTWTISIDTNQWNTPNIKKQISCKAAHCPQVSQMPHPHSFFPNMLGKWYNQDLNPGLQSQSVYHQV